MILIYISAAVYAVAAAVGFGRELKRRDERQRAAEIAEREAREEAGRRREGEEIRRILLECHKALGRARVTSFGPWISAAVNHDGPGRGEALAALELTARDLAGTRFDTDETAGILARAALEIEGVGA